MKGHVEVKINISTTSLYSVLTMLALIASPIKGFAGVSNVSVKTTITFSSNSSSMFPTAYFQINGTSKSVGVYSSPTDFPDGNHWTAEIGNMYTSGTDGASMQALNVVTADVTGTPNTTYTVHIQGHFKYSIRANADLSGDTATASAICAAFDAESGPITGPNGSYSDDETGSGDITDDFYVGVPLDANGHGSLYWEAGDIALLTEIGRTMSGLGFVYAWSYFQFDGYTVS